MPIATEKQYRLNDQIGAPTVRLIGVDGQQVGVVSIVEALRSAEEAGLDLVEISPTANPPVCRIMDFGKYRYQESKRRAAARKHQKEIHIKELKFRPGTDEGDYQVKLKQLKKFLEKGDKAKITLRFRGRELVHQELGMEILQRLERDLAGLGVVEQRPKMEGRMMVMVVAPRRK